MSFFLMKISNIQLRWLKIVKIVFYKIATLHQVQTKQHFYITHKYGIYEPLFIQSFHSSHVVIDRWLNKTNSLNPFI